MWLDLKVEKVGLGASLGEGQTQLSVWGLRIVWGVLVDASPSKEEPLSPLTLLPKHLLVIAQKP